VQRFFVIVILSPEPSARDKLRAAPLSGINSTKNLSEFMEILRFAQDDTTEAAS
jgi:hypothetical protein